MFVRMENGLNMTKTLTTIIRILYKIYGATNNIILRTKFSKNKFRRSIITLYLKYFLRTCLPFLKWKVVFLTIKNFFKSV